MFSSNNTVCLTLSVSLTPVLIIFKREAFHTQENTQRLLLTHTREMCSEFSLSWLVRDGKSTEQLFFQSGKFDFIKGSKKGLKWDVTCAVLMNGMSVYSLNDLGFGSRCCLRHRHTHTPFSTDLNT